ncbi:MAG: TetR family transcriptional regulator [Gammaproteobacteria bacterium]|nr:TetR family transcriptional regulator [Gammaproteobacteria bacterium]
MKKKSDRLPSEDRRKQLIEATLACLMQDGTSGLSSRKICAQAGVSLGLLNHHFANQVDLLAAAYETISVRYHQDLRARIASNKDNHSAPVETLVACAFDADLISPDQLRAWIVFWSQAIDSPVMRAMHDTINERFQTYLIEILSQSFPQLDADQLRALAIEYSALADGLWLDWSLNSKNQDARSWQAILEQWLARTLASA